MELLFLNTPPLPCPQFNIARYIGWSYFAFYWHSFTFKLSRKRLANFCHLRIEDSEKFAEESFIYPG
jgi:hypothetical protein